MLWFRIENENILDYINCQFVFHMESLRDWQSRVQLHLYRLPSTKRFCCHQSIFCPMFFNEFPATTSQQPQHCLQHWVCFCFWPRPSILATIPIYNISLMICFTLWWPDWCYWPNVWRIFCTIEFALSPQLLISLKLSDFGNSCSPNVLSHAV